MSEPSGKREAQRRVERIAAFREQLEELVREGVVELTSEQRSRLELHLDGVLARLAEKFDVDISDAQKRISLGMRILSTLGGLAFCAAVFLFFYRYWDLLTTPVQVAVLGITPVACVLAMQFSARREKTLYFTALIGLVAFASFILNMVVIGIIFNITPSQNAFLAWGAFALALAYAYRFRLLLAAGLICLIVFAAGTMAAWSGVYWAACAERPEFFVLAALAVWLVPLIVRHKRAAEFPNVYWLTGLLFVFIALDLLMHQGWMSLIPLGRKSVQAIYQVLAFAAAGTAVWLGIRHRLMAIVNLGCAAFALYLFDRLITWWWDWMPRYLFFLIVGTIAVGLLAVFRRVRFKTMRVQPS